MAPGMGLARRRVLGGDEHRPLGVCRECVGDAAEEQNSAWRRPRASSTTASSAHRCGWRSPTRRAMGPRGSSIMPSSLPSTSDRGRPVSSPGSSTALARLLGWITLSSAST